MSADTPPSLYRLVRGQRPQVGDFQSVMISESRAPNSVERARPELWAGVSHFDSQASARKMGQGRPALGTWIAELDVARIDADWIVVGHPGRRGHRTIWANPRRLLAAVVAVTPV